MTKIFHAINPIGGDYTLCGDAISELDKFVARGQSLPEIGFPITCIHCLRIIDACVDYDAKQSKGLATGTAVAQQRETREQRREEREPGMYDHATLTFTLPLPGHDWDKHPQETRPATDFPTLFDLLQFVERFAYDHDEDDWCNVRISID